MGERIPLDRRFWTKVDRRGDDECWPWLAYVTKRGYGRFTWRDESVASHRFAYLYLVGPIPDGLVIDHTCHTRDAACAGGNTCLHRRCTNPAHMQPVPSEVNVSRAVGARKTHCKWGHPFTAENTKTSGIGHARRRCRICLARRKREHKARHRTPRPPKPKPTHCRYGHPYAGENLYVVPSTGVWQCRACNRASEQRRKDRRRLARLSGQPGATVAA